jgi:hypothetical protein
LENAKNRLDDVIKISDSKEEKEEFEKEINSRRKIDILKYYREFIAN